MGASHPCVRVGPAGPGDPPRTPGLTADEETASDAQGYVDTTHWISENVLQNMLEITRQKNAHTCTLTHSWSSICKMMSYITLYSHSFLMKQFGDEARTASETGKVLGSLSRTLQHTWSRRYGNKTSIPRLGATSLLWKILVPRRRLCPELVWSLLSRETPVRLELWWRWAQSSRHYACLIVLILTKCATFWGTCFRE